MRQILFSGGQATVARVPRPTVAPGHVLVRVRYSLVSTGTETASLRPLQAGTAGTTTAERVSDISARAQVYLAKAVRDPRKAAAKLKEMVSVAIRRRMPEAPRAPAGPVVEVGAIDWREDGMGKVTREGATTTIVTDASESSYQASASPIAVEPGYALVLNLRGKIEKGAIIIGMLNHDRSSWLGNYRLEAGDLDETLHFDPAGSPEVTLMITNAGSKTVNVLKIAASTVTLVPPDGSGLPISEMTQVGWNVGYSVAGEVVSVGEGVDGFAVGDAVSCCGAGIANHADYVMAPRNLVCRLPADCPMDLASTATVGSIALQGVRRAQPQLGEVVAVVGLGLLGMITVQLLKASGVRVIGIDLDPHRAERAVGLGAHATTTDPQEFLKLVRNATGGHGADQTIITAASKSNALVNMAMEATRRKGRVVIVGDIGLKAERATFYQKEIDLLMSTSYGPGRYDPDYELRGRDYPIGYVRWTMNRNMQAYLEAIAGKAIDIRALIDRVATIDQAGELYKELVDSKQAPLAVLFAYPDDTRELPDPPDSPVIQLRGHRKPQEGRINFALVGAGGFGTAMLVPQMERRKDRYFLKAVVSRDAVRGGNFARSKNVELVASDLESVLARDDIHLVVLATRHNEHAGQVIRALEAGKHVFVEKPLALTFDELDAVKAAYEANGAKNLLMVGFNRRFSPAVQAVMKELEGRGAPVIINYRLNAGYLPMTHWTQGPEGGGRNIGEACHMYDLFRAMAGAPPVEISATAVDTADTAYARNDNFVATIRYGDGSVGTLVYTAMGPKEGMPKERIEIICNGEAYIVDDFKSAVRCSDGQVLWQGAVDKGHFEELSRLGDAIATGGPAPIPFEELLETSAVAIHVEDLIFGRLH
jgi:predicted dehydrogenase/threonine dehydrogenase-like Zn-dependent dehydrogenase